MKLKVKEVDLSTGGPLVAVIDNEDAKKLDLRGLDRIRIKRLKSSKEIIANVDISTKGIKPGQVGLLSESLERLGVEEGTSVDIETAQRPDSIEIIRKKLDGHALTKEDLIILVKDILSDRLSEVEITYFVAGAYTKGFTLEESAMLTEITVDMGYKLKLNKKIILDKHCLSGDVPVMVKNSGKTKVEGIGQIIDMIFKRCNKDEISTFDGAEFTDKNLKNLHVPTYDEKGEVSYKPVSGVFRAKSPDYLYKVTLRGNRSVKTTSDHTIFVLKNGCIKNIPTRHVKKGDFVIVPSLLKQDHETKQVRIKTDHKIRNYRIFPKEIEITPYFVRLLAYYISEGFTNYQGVFLNFGSHEKELIEDSIDCIKKVFGFTPTVNKPHETAVRVCMYSKTLAKIFKGLKLGSDALHKSIPYFVFDVNKGLKLEFLRTLIKCDGYLRRGYEAEYGTSSKKLATQLQYFLSTLNISFSTTLRKPTKRKFEGRVKTSDVKEHYQIYTQARELFQGRQKSNVAFTNLLPIKELGEIDTKSIGWEFRRALKRQRFVTKQKLKTIQQFIISKDISKFLEGHLSVLEVKNVDKIISDSEYVYDFKVDGYNRFMAGTAPICVHNCVGGIPGNRTSMILVPIIAAAGFTIPKTSSRSITSPAGTADVMEVFAPVVLDHKKVQEVVKKTNGCIIWQSSLNPHGADEKLIKVRHPLSLDPEGLLLASIMAKKKAVGATHVLIDIPCGDGAKFSYKQGAELKQKFIRIGERLGIKVKVIMTDGSQPIGSGIGPALEARDVLEILKGDGPADLLSKVVFMATEMLKMVGVKNAKRKVIELLNSGAAYNKFLEIIRAQGGRKTLTIPNAKYFYSVEAPKKGVVKSINNKLIAKIARIAGSPEDKAAGIYLNVRRNNHLHNEDVLFTVYSNSMKRLQFAKDLIEKNYNKVVEVV
ncbi:MAG: LAGLIDADG family homing endonuclease [Nanoarchaeota archaeon]|nr:LAGLIDADG family homing endonuclease [Nanoarchaeota archaeon]